MNRELFFASAGDERATPKTLFDALDAEFHFDLDAAASPDNAKCESFYTDADDALSRPWRFFDCGCLFEVRTGVPDHEAILLAEQAEAEWPSVVVQEVPQGSGQGKDGVASSPRSGSRTEGEAASQPKRKGQRGETSKLADSQSQAAGSIASICVDDRDVGEVPSGLGSQVRPLRGESGEARTGSRDTADRSSLPRNSSVYRAMTKQHFVFYKSALSGWGAAAPDPDDPRPVFDGRQR